MKQLLVVSLALFFYVSPGQAQQPASPPAAQAGKDQAKVEALMAPEVALYRWDGELLASRPDWLDFLYRTEIKEYTVRNISARAYGEFGVVTLVCAWAGVNDGVPFDIHSVMVDTWRRTNGKWQVVARNSCTQLLPLLAPLALVPLFLLPISNTDVRPKTDGDRGKAKSRQNDHGGQGHPKRSLHPPARLTRSGQPKRQLLSQLTSLPRDAVPVI